jgi:hypothetical protein
MKEPYRKGLANHPDPESCAGGRKVAGEALTGAHAGPAIEFRNHAFGVPTLWLGGEGYIASGGIRESDEDATESEN